MLESYIILVQDLNVGLREIKVNWLVKIWCISKRKRLVTAEVLKPTTTLAKWLSVQLNVWLNGLVKWLKVCLWTKWSRCCYLTLLIVPSNYLFLQVISTNCHTEFVKKCSFLSLPTTCLTSPQLLTPYRHIQYQLFYFQFTYFPIML